MANEQTAPLRPRRRRKRESSEAYERGTSNRSASQRRSSNAHLKHGNDAPSGGIEALFPSLIVLAILVCGVMAKMGFRGRASVAGIDLGTTNSVICVQQLDKGVGKIDCIPDPQSESPIVPSVVSFLEPVERKVGPSSKTKSSLVPHPSHVIVGTAAKKRIDTHPHSTLYQAKRVLGRVVDDPAVAELQSEVEYRIEQREEGIVFSVPEPGSSSPLQVSPTLVGSYVVSHLIEITKAFLGHEQVKSAVICVPAKFDTVQRQQTVNAFRNAGVTVTRILEEPTAAALAYGLDRQEGVEHILVYDFGGGTLDVSVLHVNVDGFVDVMGSDGDDRLGGADFDAAVSHFLLESRSQVIQRVRDALKVIHGDDHEVEDEVLAHECPRIREMPLCTLSSFHTIGEQLKIGLSEYPNGDGVVSSQCLTLPDSHGPLASVSAFCDALEATTLVITSAQYERAIEPLLSRSSTPVNRLLTDLDLTSAEMDQVVLVGGTTRMPQIRKIVAQILPGATINSHIDPDLTVAYGAASVVD